MKRCLYIFSTGTVCTQINTLGIYYKLGIIHREGVYPREAFNREGMFLFSLFFEIEKAMFITVTKRKIYKKNSQHHSQLRKKSILVKKNHLNLNCPPWSGFSVHAACSVTTGLQIYFFLERTHVQLSHHFGRTKQKWGRTSYYSTCLISEPAILKCYHRRVDYMYMQFAFRVKCISVWRPKKLSGHYVRPVGISSDIGKF